MFSFSMQPPKYGRRYSTWENGWTPEELDRIIMYCDSLPLAEAQIGSGAQGESLHRTRNSYVAWIQANEATRWIYERLQSQVLALNAEEYGFALSGFQELQFTSYRGTRGQKGQHYGWHIDEMGNTSPPNERPVGRGEQRKLSAVLQLTDPTEYNGGDLHVQAGEQVTALKRRGLVSVFPSYVRHCVTPVTQGRRCTLVAWAYGPEFF